MKLTIIKTGEVPEPLRDAHGSYPGMFEHMFERVGAGFDYETVDLVGGAPLPDPGGLAAVLITGSPAGVYDPFEWMDPLRAFVRDAYARRTPMVGICFGHQIMADALGGDVRKSEKGWGMGRHVYGLRARPDFLGEAPEALAIACSHQDQVIAPPAEAEVFMASEFTPNAGLIYENGAALSIQAHPEFDRAYAEALCRLRKDRAPEALIAEALESLGRPIHNDETARSLTRFLRRTA